MINEKIKKDFKDEIITGKQMLAIMLLTSRIKELKIFVENKIKVKDKWNIYEGECIAYREILDELNKVLKNS
jgi:hypothetical protein